MALEQYGLTASARALVSERDQNFRLRCDDGRQFVLKIANAAENPLFTQFQIQALLHIAKQKDQFGSPVKAPDILPAVTGESSIHLDLNGDTHMVRVVTYLAGVPLEEIPRSEVQAQNLGAYLAYLGEALRNFAGDAAEQDLLWDMKSALQLRALLPHITDELVRGQVGDCLSVFERTALPHFAELRSQVVHNDFNPGNVLIDPQDHARPVGVIDFGDMQKSPLVVDIAVAASYFRVADGAPLRYIAEFVRGYHRVTPLHDLEIDLLFDLILTRLCATISILDWRASMRGADDPYLQNSHSAEVSAAAFLGRLLELPRNQAGDIFRQACEIG